MGKKERMLRRALGQSSAKESKEVWQITFLKNSFLGKTWYLSSWIEKLIFALGFVALIWTILKLTIFGTF